MKISPPPKPPISVRSKDGWCATFKKTTSYADSIKTVCGMKVTLPWAIEERWPDCPECCKRLEQKEDDE